MKCIYLTIDNKLHENIFMLFRPNCQVVAMSLNNMYHSELNVAFLVKKSDLQQTFFGLI